MATPRPPGGPVAPDGLVAVVGVGPGCPVGEVTGVAAGPPAGGVGPELLYFKIHDETIPAGGTGPGPAGTGPGGTGPGSAVGAVGTVTGAGLGVERVVVAVVVESVDVVAETMQ